MTSPDKPKPPKAPPRKPRTGFGAFTAATAPTAAPPPTGPTAPPGPAPQPAPAAGDEVHPDPHADHPDPTGRQLAHPSELFDDARGGDFMDALLAGPPVDPMLDLVPLGAMVPRHYKRALDTMAYVTGRRKQDLIQQALAELLGEQLLAKSLRRR